LARTRPLPTPRLIEAEELQEPAPQKDVFSDFASFGLRVAGLVADESQRRSHTRHCSPFTTETNSEINYHPRRRRRETAAEAGFGKHGEDTASGKLIAIGIAVFALFGVALIGIAIPERSERSRAVVRKALPAPETAATTPIESPEGNVLAGNPTPAGSELD
jgi:hypothetical protein